MKVCATRHIVIEAKLRRITIATERTTPMPITRPRPASTVLVATSPSSKLGRMTSSITRPMAKLDATVEQREHRSTGDGDGKQSRVHPDELEDEPGIAARPLESPDFVDGRGGVIGGLIGGLHVTFLPAVRASYRETL